MSRFLLDTNVISEIARKKPDSRLLAWVGKLPSMALAAVTVYEIASGIHRLPSGDKRAFLEDWFAELLGSGCDIIPFDREAALACAALEADARHARRTIETRDLFILATAKSRTLGVATRNVSHFRGLGVPIYDPYKDVHLI
jgi:predicted nucleic acid-binding protein